MVDFGSLDIKHVYRLMTDAVVPRPIAFVSTLGSGGSRNLSPFSYFNAVCSDPPAVMFSVTPKRDGEPKDTLRNILETREFVVNSANLWLADKINHASADFE